MNYKIKTRNWNSKRWVLNLLSITNIFGAGRVDDHTDGDGKFYLETKSMILAWGIWLYFMALRRWSGGWTYIVRPGNQLGDGYKTIY